jgi:tetratricopeptide (TPR) repeat protein
MHDLLRLCAIERLDLDDTSAGREAAWHRIVEHYRHAIYLAGELIRSVPANVNAMPTAGTLPTDATFTSRDDALGWLERERRATLAIAAQASMRDDDSSTFAEDARRYMIDFLNTGGYLSDTETLAALGMDTAERLGRFAAASFCASGLAMVQLRTGRLVAAKATAASGIEFAEHAQDRQKEANCRLTLALALLRSGEYDESAAEFDRAMDICQSLENPYAQAIAMHNRAEILLECDQPREATALVKRSLDIRAEFDDAGGWLLGNVSLGKAQCLLGDIDEAHATLSQALKLSVELHYRTQRMQILIALAKIDLLHGVPASAKESAEEALSVARDLDAPYGEVLAMKLLAAALEADGRAEAAARHIAAADQIQRDRAPMPNASLDRILALKA